jgi:hypothetical protein
LTRYFFNYRDAAHYYADGEGTDHETLAAAEADARLSARELLGSERGESEAAFQFGSYEICDAAGQILAIVKFTSDSAIA